MSHTLRIDLPDGGHRHTSELLRYDQAHPDPLGDAGVEDLVVAAVEGAVLAPERELTRSWFSWHWLFPDDLVDGLVRGGRLERPAPGWVSSTCVALNQRR